MTRADWTYDCALDDVMNENGDINYQRLCKVYHSGMDSLETEHEAAIAEKDARVSELESANEGLVEAIVKVRDDFKCGVAEHEVWAINILTETLNKFAKGNL